MEDKCWKKSTMVRSDRSAERGVTTTRNVCRRSVRRRRFRPRTRGDRNLVTAIHESRPESGSTEKPELLRAVRRLRVWELLKNNATFRLESNVRTPCELTTS